VSTVFLRLGHDQAGAQDRFGMLYFILLCVGFIANDAVPTVVDSRPVFYREQASGAYRSITYLIALIVTDFPSKFPARPFFSWHLFKFT
jgi:hypothetical protein